MTPRPLFTVDRSVLPKHIHSTRPYSAIQAVINITDHQSNILPHYPVQKSLPSSLNRLCSGILFCSSRKPHSVYQLPRLLLLWQVVVVTLAQAPVKGVSAQLSVGKILSETGLQPDRWQNEQSKKEDRVGCKWPEAKQTALEGKLGMSSLMRLFTRV